VRPSSELEKARPRDCAVLTQELVDLVGPPPIPPLRPDIIEHFRVVYVISLNADDRHLRVYLRMKEAGSDTEKGRRERDYSCSNTDASPVWVSGFVPGLLRA